MFYLIGLGLGDCKDITVKGLEIVKKCEKVYLESYTSVLTVGMEALETFYDKKLIIADRDLVEQGADDILQGADTADVALLVVGDPFGATTHTDLALRCKEKGIQYRVVHNASIMSAIGCCGLQLYSFGETVSIPYWTETWTPDSFYPKLLGNFTRNLHTLCLLDIKVKEPTLESMTKKVKQYMPPKFMSVKEAAEILLSIVKRYKEKGDDPVISGDTMCVGLARVGSEDQGIVYCSLNEMARTDLGKPLHSLIVPGSSTHPLELEYLEQFRK